MTNEEILERFGYTIDDLDTANLRFDDAGQIVYIQHPQGYAEFFDSNGESYNHIIHYLAIGI